MKTTRDWLQTHEMPRSGEAIAADWIYLCSTVVEDWRSVPDDILGSKPYDSSIYRYMRPRAKAQPLPVIGSRWKHYDNHQEYEVYDFTNEGSTKPEYPHMVSYRGDNGKKWSRRVDDWHRSMRPIAKETKEITLHVELDRDGDWTIRADDQHKTLGHSPSYAGALANIKGAFPTDIVFKFSTEIVSK